MKLIVSELLLKIAKSKIAAKAAAKKLSRDQLGRAIDNLKSVMAAIEHRESKERARNLKKIKAMMAEMGLSAEDMRGLSSKKAPAKRGRPKKKAAKRKAGPKKGTKVAPKYQIKVGKQTHKWTGRGRMPLVFKEYVEKGGALEKCLIK